MEIVLGLIILMIIGVAIYIIGFADGTIEQRKLDEIYYKQDFIKIIKNKLNEVENQPRIIGGRTQGKTLEYGKQLGKIEILNEIWHDFDN
jgi:hypothetical protein